MPRSALASCPGRVPAYAHPTTRSYKGHTPLAALSIRPQEIAQVTSEGAGDSLVLGLVEYADQRETCDRFRSRQGAAPIAGRNRCLSGFDHHLVKPPEPKALESVLAELK